MQAKLPPSNNKLKCNNILPMNHKTRKICLETFDQKLNFCVALINLSTVNTANEVA